MAPGEARAIVVELGVGHPDGWQIAEVQSAVEGIWRDFETDAVRPSSADQAEVLRRFSAALGRFDLGRLGLQQRATLRDRLVQFKPPPAFSSAHACLTYFYDALAIWQIETAEGRATVPRPLRAPFDQSLNLLARMDDWAFGALCNRLALGFERARIPDQNDPVSALESCRQRLLAAITPATGDVRRRGRPTTPGLHPAVSRLAATYEMITGKRVAHWGEPGVEDYEPHPNPFAEFAAWMLGAAGQHIGRETLDRAIEALCAARNRREKAASRGDDDSGGN